MIPSFDAQLPEVMRRYPEAEMLDGDNPMFPKILHIEKYPLSEKFNKWHTNLWVPIPVSFPVLAPDWGSFPFSIYTDVDLRFYYGGYPRLTETVTWSQPLGRKETLRWLGWFHAWNPRRDGLYTWMMVLKRYFTEPAPWVRNGTLWEEPNGV